MNLKHLLALIFICLWSHTFLAHAQVPQLFNYQGRIVTDGTNFDGSGQFKFALVNAAGAVSFWSNDGTSVAGSQPTAQVTLTVTRGLYSVLLGDTSIASMTMAIPITVFTNPDVRLRVWFNDNVTGFQQLSPDQRIAAVGYAMMGANVPDEAITSAKIAPGAVGTTQLAEGAVTGGKISAGAVTSATLADSLALGNPTNAAGRLDIYRAASSNTPAISLIGSANQISTFGDDGTEQVRLGGPSWGEVLLFDSTPSNHLVVNLSANNNGGGRLLLYDTNGPANGLGSLNVDLRAEVAPGSRSAWASFNDNGAERIALAARNGATGRGGLIDVKNDGSFNTIKLTGDTGGGQGQIAMVRTNGSNTVEIRASELGDDGAELVLRNADGVATFEVDADLTGTGDAEVYLRNGSGITTVILDADAGGSGRVTTQILQITGGSDLSEQFNIRPVDRAVEPGMVVCVDSRNPGELVVSSQAYDRTAAGVVSGAGGVKPGMLMGQKGSAADGNHAVALTGRVYCLVDTCNGSIEAGDLITTSNTPGHGMKVTDHAKAHGAVIGKAMSPLTEGKGLVLVLVSLQ